MDRNSEKGLDFLAKKLVGLDLGIIMDESESA